MGLALDWALFRKMAMHPNSPPGQVRDMRMAFYGGAQAAVAYLVNAMSDNREPTAEDEKKVEALINELGDYRATLMAEAEVEAVAAKPPSPATANKSDYRVPVSDEIREKLKDMARRIKTECPDGWGFALLLFMYGDGGPLLYMSSAEREDMLKVLQEFLQKQGS